MLCLLPERIVKMLLHCEKKNLKGFYVEILEWLIYIITVLLLLLIYLIVVARIRRHYVNT